MADIKIHGVPPSTFTRTVRLGCHEKGIDYEIVAARPDGIGALNPFGKIPAMTHGDLTLFESSAILRYLDRVFPGPKLWPEEARQAALCDQWASAICDSLVGAALPYFGARFGFRQMPADQVARHLERIRALMPIFEQRLGASRYLAGENVTAADLYLVPIFFYFPEVPELKAIGEASPNCVRWAREMGGRSSVKATDPQFKPHLAA
ncbi:MAG: glutathione S-transferase family protein [Alphaproteobacteria bacterium]|nr:glutathione S-transferase family protein [Alphaproteobacteria bacterium]